MPGPFPGNGPVPGEAPVLGRVGTDAQPDRYHRQLNFRWWGLAIVASVAIWAFILLR